jgi:hypothetical protein
MFKLLSTSIALLCRVIFIAQTKIIKQNNIGKRYKFLKAMKNIIMILKTLSGGSK